MAAYFRLSHRVYLVKEMAMTWRWLDSHQITFILIGLGLLSLAYFLSRRRYQQLKTLAHSRALSFLVQQISSRRIFIRFSSMALAIVFLGLALMRLQSPGGKLEIRSEGIEVVILADVSESMMAEDLQPNRLEQLKYDLIRLVDLMGGHQVGLVAFAGSAHLLSPLTNDPGALKMFIESLSTDVVSSQGTDIGQAIDVAIDAFERGGKEASEQGVVSRVILVASDGENHEPETLKKVRELIKEKSLQVFTLAYGTPEGAPIPQRDQLGYFRNNKKDKQGRDILTQVNGDFLKELAEFGEGQFRLAMAGRDHIKKIAQDFEKLDKKLNDTQAAVSYEEQFALFAWPALFFAALAVLLPLRKKAGATWLGRLGLILLCTYYPFETQAELTSMRSWWSYQQAQKRLLKDQDAQAKELLVDSLEFDPMSAEVHLGLGALYYKAKDFKLAETSFQYAEPLAQNADEQFVARFNLATAYQASQQIDLALKFYLKALEIRPQSFETKVNIELLMQAKNSQGQGEGEGDSAADPKDKKEPEQYKNPSQEPSQSTGSELSPSDMRKILEELRNQEKKIRNEYNKTNQKEVPRGKDW